MPEGLDVRGQLPPRLTDRVLIDLDGLTAWEAHVVATLGRTRRSTGRRSARWRGSLPTRARLAGWRRRRRCRWPARWRRWPTTRAAADLDDAAPATRRRRRAWPAWFEIAAGDLPGAVAGRRCRRRTSPNSTRATSRRSGAARRRRAPLPRGQGLRRVDHLSGRRGGLAGAPGSRCVMRCCASSAARACGAASRAARPRAAGARRSASPTCCCATTPTVWRSPGRLAIDAASG